MSVAAVPHPFGELLRSWRQRRNLSQLELALGADISSRHVSFVETGRAQPSREMVMRLAGKLEVPMRERNALLLAAGYAPIYSERSLDAPEMAPVRQALDRFLRAHEPYPAVVVDRHHNLIAANDACDLLLDGVAADLLKEPANGMRIALHPNGMAPRTLNLAEWSAHLLQRARREAQVTGDPQLARLFDELAAYPGIHFAPPHSDLHPNDLRHRHRHHLSELAIEAFYPANAHTAMRLMHDIAAEPQPSSSRGPSPRR